MVVGIAVVVVVRDEGGGDGERDDGRDEDEGEEDGVGEADGAVEWQRLYG